MHKIKILLFMILFLLFINIPILTYSSDLMFYNMGTAKGLSQATINTIYQDSFHYIWIGTSSGLNKYNGFEFEVYNKNSNKERNIVDGYISCLNEDTDNNLWIGTSDGLSKINLQTDEITNYTMNTCSLSSNKIKDIKINGNGDVIIATSNGLNIYDKVSDDFIPLIQEDFKPSSSNIISLGFYGDYDIYIISSDCFFKYNMINGEYSVINNESIDYIEKTNSFTALSIYDDNIYLGTKSEGLYVYNISTEEITEELKLFVNGNDGPSNAISHIYNDESKIYIGSNQGLYIHEKNGKTQHFKHNNIDKYSLIDDQVKHIMKDSNGLLWIGTFSGISTVNYDLGIKYYTDFYVNPNVDNNNIVLGIYEDIDEKLWLGVYNRGISIWDRKNNTVTQLNTKTTNKLNSDIIWDLKGNDQYIFATSQVGLNIINRKTLEVQHMLDNIFCLSLYVDGDYLWVGTDGGYSIINLNDFSIKSINELLDKNNLTVGLGGVIFKDSKDTYWLGSSTNDGLIEFNPKDNSLNLFSYNEFENSISDNTILSISEDNEGNLWFGTEGGLNKYNRETGKFTLYSMENGLSNNTIYSIFPYKNEIWISTNSGINCLEFEDGKITNVRKYLNEVEFSANSNFQSANGDFVLGSIYGIYIINPAVIEKSITTPKLQFDSLSVNGIEVNDLSDISIKHTNNFISIKLFTNIYNNTENIDFYYRINDEQWILMDSNEVTFSNLASKKYTIDFMAKNLNGNTSKIKTLSFKVNPPFWQNNFAKCIYFILIIIIIAYLYIKMAYMSNAIVLRNNQLAKEMLEKNKLLMKNIQLEKHKNNYLVNMSHELRTPLNIMTSIQHLLVSFNKNGPIPSDELSKYLKINDNNLKRLLKIINDLVDSTKMSEGFYKLLIKEKDIIHVIEEATLSLKKSSEEKNINLIFDTTIEECIMKFDENAIARCIVNIVDNAIKFTEPGGEVLVNIVDLYSVLKIEVHDTGVGIPIETINNIFNSFSQVINSKREVSGGSCLGLTITKGLINLHNGEIFVSSEVGKGTTFTIVLPRNN